VNTVMSLQVPKKCGEFLDYLSVLLASLEGLCSMYLVRRCPVESSSPSFCAAGYAVYGWLDKKDVVA
jgi:hypothetical protein